MTYELRVESEFFDKIKAGKKIYELRVNDEKRQQFDIGDFLVFKKRPELTETIVTKIQDLVYFKNFIDALKVLPTTSLGFEKMTKNDINKLFFTFYTQEEIKKYGIVAIRVKCLGNSFDMK